MKKKTTLNDKRLTKTQTQELIQNEGVFHEQYSKDFETNYASGLGQRDLIYELPGDRFLFVFDPNGFNIPGKGDLYSGDYFREWVAWRQWQKNGFALHGCSSSVGHWRFYSTNKANLINRIDALISTLADELKILPQLLNNSYASLDLVALKVEDFGRDNAFQTLYDSLVAYVGEVIRFQIGGIWKINNTHAGGDYPYIDLMEIQFMPLNSVWSAMHNMGTITLRSETTNMVRANGWEVKSRLSKTNF